MWVDAQQGGSAVQFFDMIRVGHGAPLPVRCDKSRRRESTHGVGALRVADLALWRQGGARLLAKQRKTAHELKDIVAGRLGIGDVLLVVTKDRIDGWRATVLTTLQRKDKIQYQASVDQIVAELRKEYDLVE